VRNPWGDNNEWKGFFLFQYFFDANEGRFNEIILSR